MSLSRSPSQNSLENQQQQQKPGDTSGSATKSISYPRILPRGNPDEHRQAMAEEQEVQESQLISERRRRNTQAAARMRERQRQRERELIQRRNDLMGRVHQLEAELAAIREQRVASEASVTNQYDSVLQDLSKELENANSAMCAIVDEVEKLVDIVRSVDR
ncbi:hypothetical protein DL89DRAFT_264726 [Linderina pennispora]|uniref:BZIP domain-containing protein n=1 Tax=Linderina pennispora TaxID=61395 RepID=A0A1Y1WN09_9FUNG|nr:uncharacterized protein DL89DRAFT_264726 [Linderina pennispora]ORX74931.1 hypothetical protein DL89DRAFT_264726 [Linderina pennispora]